MKLSRPQLATGWKNKNPPPGQEIMNPATERDI